MWRVSVSSSNPKIPIPRIRLQVFHPAGLNTQPFAWSYTYDVCTEFLIHSFFLHEEIQPESYNLPYVYGLKHFDTESVKIILTAAPIQSQSICPREGAIYA